jgi:hypothetical protein
MATDTTTATQPGTVTIGGRYYPPHVVTVDGDAGPVDIPIRVKRLTHGELADFVATWAKIENPESAKRWHRLPDSDEVAIEATPRGSRFVIPDGEIRRRRLEAMTAEERAEIEALEVAEGREAYFASVETVRAYVGVSPKWPSGDPFTLTIDDDGTPRPAVTGADLVELFGGNLATITRLAGIVAAENMLDAEKKTRSRGRSGSNTGSHTAPPEAGKTPAATVADAAPPDSVPFESA